MSFDSDNTPEEMVIGMGQQLPKAVYYSLANAKPEWIDEDNETLINIPDRKGRFSRAADGTKWISGEIHGDAIRNITGNIELLGRMTWNSATGVFSKGDKTTNSVSASGGGGGTIDVNFDASGQVPTSDENQPKGYIEWVGYAL